MTTWNVDSAHSAVNFSVRHMVFAKVRGRFAQWSAQLDLDPADLTKASVSVEIEATSIDTGVVDRDNHLRSTDFFNVAEFPRLTFVSKKVEKAGSKYAVHGDLTIRGTTHPVVLDVVYDGTGKDPWGNQRTGFTASTSINRFDYGLNWNQALEAGGVLVGEKVEIEIELQAVAG